MAAEHSVLRVIGPDRESFVQGMVTNDVAGLGLGQSCLAAALTPKGALVGVLRVSKGSDALLLDVLDGRGAAVKAHLERYLVSEDAEVSEAGDVAVLSLVGADPAALGEASSLLGAGSCLGHLEGSLGLGLDVLVPASRLGELQAALRAFPRLDDAEAERVRVERGVPRFGADVGETTLPLEGGLEGAVHLQKGCYVGQEVIARMTYRGHVNKRLVGLRLEPQGEIAPPAPTARQAPEQAPALPGGGPGAPGPGLELRSAGQKVGWLTSVAWSEALGAFVALGYLRRDFAELGQRVELASGGTATVRALPTGASGSRPAPGAAPGARR